MRSLSCVPLKNQADKSDQIGFAICSNAITESGIPYRQKRMVVKIDSLTYNRAGLHHISMCCSFNQWV